MPTLKFCNFYEDGAHRIDAVTCTHYEVYRPASGPLQVSTYRDDTNVNGVTRYVSKEDDGHADVCFVENDQGKTIDRLK